MTKLNITQTATDTLEAWLTGLMLGQIQLYELPPAVSAIYMAGHSVGHAARQVEVDQLSHECDRLYSAAFTPKEIREQLKDRMDQRAAEEEEWRAFMAAQTDTAPEPAPHTLRLVAV